MKRPLNLVTLEVMRDSGKEWMKGYAVHRAVDASLGETVDNDTMRNVMEGLAWSRDVVVSFADMGKEVLRRSYRLTAEGRAKVPEPVVQAQPDPHPRIHRADLPCGEPQP